MIEIEWHIEDPGDPSVGLDGSHSRVRVTFLDRLEPLEEDEINEMRAFWAEWGDGRAYTHQEYEKMLREDQAADNAMYQDYLEDRLRRYDNRW